MIIGEFFFSNLSSGQQYLLNEIKKIPENMASYEVKVCLKKKEAPRAQIVRFFFRYESRNNKSARISGQSPECLDCPLFHFE